MEVFHSFGHVMNLRESTLRDASEEMSGVHTSEIRSGISHSVETINSFNVPFSSQGKINQNIFFDRSSTKPFSLMMFS